MDSSKFGHVSFVKTMQMKEGDILVTDQDLPEEWRAFLAERSVRLVVPEENR